MEHKKAGLVGGQLLYLAYMSGMNIFGSGDKFEIVSISVWCKTVSKS